MLKLQSTTPMTLPDIISAAWWLCVRRWRPMLTMALLSCAAILISDAGILAVLERTQPNLKPTPAMPSVPFSFAPLLVVGAMLYIFSQLALIRFSLEAWIGEGGSLRRAYAAATRAYLPALIAIVIAFVVLVVGILTWLGLPVAVYFVVSWVFAGQVCLTEYETRPLRAIRRSRAIVKGAWWRTAGVLLSIALLALLPSLLADRLRLGPWAPSLLISAIATAISAPFSATAQTMLYVDLRLRKHESITLNPSRPSEPL